ncbi:hypothetical protein [Streptomyces sp. NPDC055036]
MTTPDLSEGQSERQKEDIMASLRGKGAMTEVNLIAKVYKNGVTKDGRTHYADVQIDARDARGPEQTSLHLRSDRTRGDDGKIHYNNGAPYSTGQIEEIARAAGPNTKPILNKDGNEIGTLYGFKGNVMPATHGTGLVVNTKSVKASEFKVDERTLDNQFTSMRAASEAAAARKVKTPAPEAEPTAEQAAAGAIEEPAVG